MHNISYAIYKVSQQFLLINFIIYLLCIIYYLVYYIINRAEKGIHSLKSSFIIIVIKYLETNNLFGSNCVPLLLNLVT